MSTIEAKIITLLTDLPQSCDINESLAELKPLMMSAKPSELTNVMEKFDLGPLLNLLYEISDETTARDATSVFNIILESLPSNYTIIRFQKEMLLGLESNNEAILELWLKPLLRCLNDDTTIRNLINANVSLNPIMANVVMLIGYDITSIAMYCHNILLRIATYGCTQSLFYSDALQDKLNDMKDKNDIVRMRVYDLLVAIANSSTLAFHQIEERGNLSDLITYFNDSARDDPLITLNCTQIISDLASTLNGVEFLERTGELKIITDKICEDSHDPFKNILLPGYVKIFGTIGHNKPIILNDYPSATKKLFSMFSETDHSLLMSAIDAIGIIGKRNDGKKFLSSNPLMNEKCLNRIGSLLTCSGNEIKIRAVSALSNLFDINESDPNGEANTTAHSWYTHLVAHNKITQTIISLCRQPFRDVRLAALELIRVLASNVWGQKELASFAGFLDYLLDRSTETEKEGKEAKYGIVRELVNSPFISLSFSREAITQLRNYYKDGPYFVSTEFAVAFEGAN